MSQIWPPVTHDCRPWTRWWWMGSAVTEAEITRHLRLFQEAGIGGVEVSPIYGVTGAGEQDRYISFLGPAWMRMLRHTVREARRLDMDVDLITGTGWPLGGPWVRAEDAAARVLLEAFAVAENGRVPSPIVSKTKPEARLCALMGFAQDKRVIDLTNKVNPQRQLDWTAPPGQWTLQALFQTETGQQVKRAAPGGEGNVVDPFSANATARYLAFFDNAFTPLSAEETVRCFFNDSYEVYGANGTGDLLAQFERRRGYDLKNFLLALAGRDDSEVNRRVRSDYRQTIAELLLDQFVEPWTRWANGKGARTRHQAHGSPGNLLDLYAAADIPETEAFGTAWLGLAGLDPLEGTPRDHGGRAEILACKLASSAAHVAGKPLCAAETATWLGEHGKVPLEHVKAELDMLFVMGVNHVFFHGSSFSPADVEWPGWMFYATTHFGPTNPWWRDLPALNAYIARCQSFLQAGQPDNDLLVYFPIFDLWAGDANPDDNDLLRFLSVHNTEQWLDENLPDFTNTGRWLWEHGYGFDFVSDQLLQQAVTSGQQLQAGEETYRALVVAGCRVMPPETWQRILDLARNGAVVLVIGTLPDDVPGLVDLEARRERLRSALSDLDRRAIEPDEIFEAVLGKGRLLVGPNGEALLRRANVQRESVVDRGIEFIRRRDEAGFFYFLTNLGPQRVEQWVCLAIKAESALFLDPMDNRSGQASIRQADGHTQLYLQLEPGESVLVRALSQKVESPPWQYLSPDGPPRPLEGVWHVEFVAGGPTLPQATHVGRLASWTDGPDATDASRAFSGTARYTIRFDKPAGDVDAWALDLGEVCHSARITLNNQNLGTRFARPFRIAPLPELRERDNLLEIEVTNLMANRLADLDQRGVAWRNFFFVNIAYQSFDASGWQPMPSGLLGPVQLVPLRSRRDP